MGGICIKDIKIVEHTQMGDSPKDKGRNNNDSKLKQSNITSDIIIQSKRSSVDDIKSKRGPQKKINNDLPINEEININSHVELKNNEINSTNKPKILKKTTFKLDNIVSNESGVLQVIKKHNKESEDAKLIDGCLTKHFFMKVLDKHSRAEIIKEMSLCSVKDGDTLFSQGTTGNYFYILKQGQVQLLINDKVVKILEEGSSFGELALLHGAPRSGTVIAQSECLFWVLERKSFKRIIEHISNINYEENKNFIQSISILANIENDQKTVLCSNLIKEIYEPGFLIVKAGEVANCLYIIKEGEVDCIVSKTVIRTLKKGDHFGQRAILMDSTRTMDVVAKTQCVCYSISIETLKSMVGEKYREALFLNFIKSSFANSVYFKQFNHKLIESFYDCFTIINFDTGEVVIPKGHLIGSKLIVVIEGNIMNSKTKEIFASRGHILYEKEVVQGSSQRTDYNFIANPDCLIVQADVEELSKFLGGSIIDLISKSSLIQSLTKVHLFKNFTQNKLELLAEKIRMEKYEDGKKIITQGEEGSKFYIVKSGKVDIYINNNYIRTLNENEYFGDRALFFKETRSASAIANGTVELFFLEKLAFTTIIENNMKEFLIKRLFLQDNTLELKDFDYIQQLGSGNYGLVSLIQSKKTKFFYAIKGISKKQIDYEQLHKNLELERAILLQIDHPFIVKLVKTLKDKEYIYFLMEYIKGKELFDVIREIGLLNKYQAQFYGASLMLAVEYLHERKFIYRDIKPENIMVIENGYIKLIDFGTAKQIVDRTTTIIGTPHYMAPEVILGEGYSFAVDYWSIAICLYEFMCGGVPFGESADEPMDVYLMIINDQMVFPTFCKDKEFKHLMTSMLSKNPIHRLFKLKQIKNNIWFKDFNWENLLGLNADPPFVPEIPNPLMNVDNISFSKYCQKYSKEWEPEKVLKIDNKKKAEYDKWFLEF